MEKVIVSRVKASRDDSRCTVVQQVIQSHSITVRIYIFLVKSSSLHVLEIIVNVCSNVFSGRHEIFPRLNDSINWSGQ